MIFDVYCLLCFVCDGISVDLVCCGMCVFGRCLFPVACGLLCVRRAACVVGCVRFLFSVVRYALFVVRCSSFVVDCCCVSCVDCCLAYVVPCALFVVCRLFVSSFGMRCWLLVACCLLFVACCVCYALLYWLLCRIRVACCPFVVVCCFVIVAC